MKSNDIDWYHGSMTREEAERTLLNYEIDDKEGLFLIRDSATSIGDYVLSVIVKDNLVIHYQIRRHRNGGIDEDDSPLFSLAENTNNIIHGLDEFVNYYRFCTNSGLQHRLGPSYVVGNASPHPRDFLHGTENLLHRAVANGDLVVVTELLKCGYRNLAAKNHDGQTAVHLASFYGHNEILKCLIQYGATAETDGADSSGYSPLHFACQSRRPETIRILLNDGNADPTIRNRITGWVPLHEAAWKGYADCCQVLLEFHSPALPRTPKNETPGDLARANGHHHLATFIEHYNSIATISATEWYHPTLDRASARTKLREIGKNRDGAFLIRDSKKRRNTFVLSLCFRKRYHHFEIVKQGIYYFLAQGPYMRSLEHLVEHYSRFADGLPINLRHPVPTADPKTTTISTPNTDGTATLPKIDVQGSIPISAIKMNRVIGEGEFGLVYEGTYTGRNEEKKKKIPVAVKVLLNNESQATDFLREANVMMKLDHHCVVQFIGVSCGPPILMVLELVPLGSLLQYVIDYSDVIQPDMEITLWAAQIACGMMYLESKKFVHRDLAARNVLLASKFQAKISDFGLSRMVKQDKDYYRASEGGRWPIKWYAPECVNYGTFSHASDVWSYGVLLYEMFSFGKIPYEDMNGAQTVKFIESGKRLNRPDGIEDKIYEVMLKCWNYEAKERPTFVELYHFFSQSPHYVNIKELLSTEAD